MKEFFNNKKNIFYLVILVILIIIFCVLLYLRNNNSTNQKDEIKKYLETTVKDYYEEKYYDQVSSYTGDIEQFLKNFEDNGLTFSINTLINNNIINQSEAEEKLVNKETKEKCDYEETKVILYPKKPYKKDSYKLKTILDCGFDSK